MNRITIDVLLTLIAVWMTALSVCQAKFMSNLPKRCAPKCICDSDEFNRKRIVCEQGGLSGIPTAQMDKEIKVINHKFNISPCSVYSLFNVQQPFFKVMQS